MLCAFLSPRVDFFRRGEAADLIDKEAVQQANQPDSPINRAKDQQKEIKYLHKNTAFLNIFCGILCLPGGFG